MINVMERDCYSPLFPRPAVPSSHRSIAHYG